MFGGAVDGRPRAVVGGGSWADSICRWNRGLGCRCWQRLPRVGKTNSLCMNNLNWVNISHLYSTYTHALDLNLHTRHAPSPTRMHMRTRIPLGLLDDTWKTCWKGAITPKATTCRQKNGCLRQGKPKRKQWKTARYKLHFPSREIGRSPTLPGTPLQTVPSMCRP